MRHRPQHNSSHFVTRTISNGPTRGRIAHENIIFYAHAFFDAWLEDNRRISSGFDGRASPICGSNSLAKTPVGAYFRFAHIDFTGAGRQSGAGGCVVPSMEFRHRRRNKWRRDTFAAFRAGRPPQSVMPEFAGGSLAGKLSASALS
jgi:hypothetical protein